MSNAVATRNNAVYKDMTQPLRKIVDKIGGRIKGINNAGTMAYYDIGAAVKLILEKRESGDLAYGENPIAQMAEHFCMVASTLYQTKILATVFKRDFVLKKTEEAADRNFMLTYNHWMQLSRITDPQRRPELLNQCISGRWAHNMIGLEAKASDTDQVQHPRAGGRKPGVPSDPVVALGKFNKLNQTLYKYADSAEQSIFSGLLDISPGDIKKSHIKMIDEALNGMEETASSINSYVASLTEIRKKLSKATKVEDDDVVEEVDDAVEEEDDEDDEEPVKPAKSVKPTRSSKKDKKGKKTAGRR